MFYRSWITKSFCTYRHANEVKLKSILHSTAKRNSFGQCCCCLGINLQLFKIQYVFWGWNPARRTNVLGVKMCLKSQRVNWLTTDLTGYFSTDYKKYFLYNVTPNVTPGDEKYGEQNWTLIGYKHYSFIYVTFSNHKGQKQQKKTQTGQVLSSWCRKKVPLKVNLLR